MEALRSMLSMLPFCISEKLWLEVFSKEKLKLPVVMFFRLVYTSVIASEAMQLADN
jgi:hypothetical protein